MAPIRSEPNLWVDCQLASGYASMAHAKRSIHPREVHQGALGRQEAGHGVFPPLPKRPISDRGRELAEPAIAKYRIYDEAVTGADRIALWADQFLGAWLEPMTAKRLRSIRDDLSGKG